MKRRTLVNNGNPDNSSSPLDVLLETGRITRDQHVAGENYARCYRAVMPSPFPRIVDPNRDGPGIGVDTIAEGETFVDSGPLSKLEPRFRAMAEVLKGLSRKTKDEVENVCVFNRWPKYLFQGLPASQALLDGLTALHEGTRATSRAA